ncbi:hypothetical protein GVAV_001075 [Gurleya vavrai]
MSIRYKFNFSDGNLNVFLYSFQPNSRKFINFCEEFYAMAALTLINNIEEIVKKNNIFFAPDTISYVIEKIINHFSEFEFYALNINYEYFKQYINILIKFNILKFE